MRDLKELPVCFRFPLKRESDWDASRMASFLPGVRVQDGLCEIALFLDDASAYRDTLFDLWARIKTNPGAEVILDGATADFQDFKQTLTILDCAKAHDAAPDPERFCHPAMGWDWGCLHLRQIAPFRESVPALLRILQEEARHKQLARCPFFDPQHMARLAQDAPVTDAPKPEPIMPGHTPPETRRNPSGATLAPATYADIGGLDTVIRDVRESIELPLRHPEVIARLGISPPKGILLHGPPGCGKTLLARAVAHESGVHFLAVSGPELITKWHGESEDNLRKIFAEAREKQPCIVFFDEIDAIAQSRSSAESLRLDARFTTQLLVLLDGVHDPGQVFVIGTTNRLDLLDPALLRPGRFDRIIAVPRPDHAAKLAILKIHANRLPLGSDVDLDALATRLNAATGADIAFLAREAAHSCLRRIMGDTLLDRDTPLDDAELAELKIESSDFEEALLALKKRDASLAESCARAS